MGTPLSTFMLLIRTCKLPAHVIKKLQLEFPSSRSRKRYGAVKYDYGDHIEDHVSHTGDHVTHAEDHLSNTEEHDEDHVSHTRSRVTKGDMGAGDTGVGDSEEEKDDDEIPSV